jgi:hypothetical protein
MKMSIGFNARDGKVAEPRGKCRAYCPLAATLGPAKMVRYVIGDYENALRDTHNRLLHNLNGMTHPLGLDDHRGLTSQSLGDTQNSFPGFSLSPPAGAAVRCLVRSTGTEIQNASDCFRGEAGAVVDNGHADGVCDFLPPLAQ